MKIDESADYYKREEGISSTSKYIQTKNKDENGNPVAGDIKSIPDQNIIQPNLKKDTAETFDMKSGGGPFDSLLSALGALGVPSLSKTKQKKEIKEQAPDFAKSEYGKIQVKETAGGFVEIFDQTIGNQRTMRLHPAGTYNQVTPDGTVQDKIVKDKITFVDEEWNIVVGKDYVEVINGNNKVHIKKDNQVNINGNSNTNIDKDCNTVINQSNNIDIKSKSTEKVGAGKTVEITGNLSQKVSSNSNEDIGGNVNNTAGGNRNDMVGGHFNIVVSGNCLISATSIGIFSKTGGSMNMTGGSINISSQRVNIN